MSLTKKYQKSLQEKWCIRLNTLHPDGDAYDGVVTHIKRSFIVLKVSRDFEFDGIMVFPKKFIKGYRDGKFEQCENEILRENGEIPKCQSPDWLDLCDSLPQVIAEMKQRDIWPGIEILFNDKSENAFYIGPITQLAGDKFFLNCYDAAGQWEKDYKLTYSEIFRIEFDTKYCTHFNNYMRKHSSA